MADTQKEDLNNSPGLEEAGKDIRHQHNDEEKSTETGTDSQGPFTAGNDTPEIATNDGSVIETLDTAFHGIPGWSEGENISGSNRADYYEARSNGKSDAEEELDELRARNKSAE